MRNFKRFLTLALAVVMMVSAFAFSTSAAAFTDVDTDNEYLTKAVNLLSYVGVTKGTTETTFGTDELVTREQMAAFIYRLMKKGNSVEGGANTSAFTDLEDPTFFFMVSWANSQGIIKGTSATTFDPKGSITLQDAYAMLVRALGYEKEEALQYPFGYIEKAEKKGVELDEGLDSSVSYTDALTRGDVAVLLYNTFFAETGVAETKQVEEEIGSGANATWVLKTVTEYPTFCEKYFDVIEVEYQAVATPNYVYTASETTDALGYEAIEFVLKNNDSGEDVPAQFYAAFEDLGLDGDADDYIMSCFKMYVTVDDDNAIEEILYAEPLMVKKTVNDIKLDTLTSNTQGSYYDAEYTVKRLSGKVVIDGTAAYFYNAPYSYAKPTYTSGMTDAEKYAERNEKNLKLIDVDALDLEEGEFALTVSSLGFVDDGSDEYYTADSVTLMNALLPVYTDALYEATVYDVDGDGIYDFIDLDTYKALFVNTDEDYTFADDNYDADGAAYTNEAVVEGVEFEDGDLVIGIFDETINYIKAVAVVEPIEGSITGIKKATGVITLNGETKVSVKDSWKLLANESKYADLIAADYVLDEVDFTAFDGLLAASAYDADDAKFYVYDGVLLAQDGISKNFDFNVDELIIVTPDKDGAYITEGAFNPTTGKTTYVHVWVDGETKYVPVDTDAEVYPELVDNVSEYLGKLATYSVDKNGLYTIKLLGNCYDDYAETEYVGMDALDEVDFADEEDDGIIALGDFGAAEGYLVKYSGKRFTINQAFDRAAANIDGLDFDVLVNADTKILIKNEYTAGGEAKVNYAEYTVDELTESIVNSLTNIQVVIANNVDYTNREDLVLLYAETSDGEKLSLNGKKATNAERIVRMMNVEKNKDGDFYATYDLLNPYTGEVEEGVVGVNTSTSGSYASKFTYGDIVEIAGGKVADEAGDSAIDNVVDATNAKYYWVLDYNKAENAIEVINVPSDGNEDADGLTTYRINVAGAPVTVIGNQSNSLNIDIVRYGSMKTATLDALDGSDKAFKAINKAYAEDADDTLKTIYGKYVKVYMSIDWDNDSDHTDVDENDFNGEANYVIIVANAGENANLCKKK